jgi:hypothetical protein
MTPLPLIIYGTDGCYGSHVVCDTNHQRGSASDGGRFWICEWPVTASTHSPVLAPFHIPWSLLRTKGGPFWALVELLIRDGGKRLIQ